MNLADKIIFLLCILVPFFNFVHLISPYGIRRINLEILTFVFTPTLLLLLISPLFIAFQIFKKQKSDKFLLLTYLVFLVIYNILLSINNSSLQNIATLVSSILISITFFFAFRKEIDAKTKILAVSRFLLFRGVK